MSTGHVLYSVPESGVLREALNIVPGGGGKWAELQCQSGRGHSRGLLIYQRTAVEESIYNVHVSELSKYMYIRYACTGTCTCTMYMYIHACTLYYVHIIQMGTCSCK